MQVNLGKAPRTPLLRLMMTLPRELKLLLMALVSVRRAPSALLWESRSEPARSIRFSMASQVVPESGTRARDASAGSGVLAVKGGKKTFCVWPQQRRVAGPDL